MNSVSDLMSGYFSEKDMKDMKKRFLLKESVPICPRRDTWEVVESPERLMKRFVFDNRMRLADFIIEVFKYEDSVDHHGQIRISGLEVDIEIYTLDINRITNRDREYANTVDLLFQDVENYAYV